MVEKHELYRRIRIQILAVPRSSRVTQRVVESQSSSLPHHCTRASVSKEVDPHLQGPTGGGALGRQGSVFKLHVSFWEGHLGDILSETWGL